MALDGRTPMKTREKVIDTFNNDAEARVSSLGLQQKFKLELMQHLSAYTPPSYLKSSLKMYIYTQIVVQKWN